MTSRRPLVSVDGSIGELPSTDELVVPSAKVSGKNSLSPRTFVGRQTTAGPPTTDTWAVDDEVMDSAGIVWRCTVAGTPGTWVARSGLAIAETVLGSAAASIDFQNIPATYRHLQVVLLARGDAAAGVITSFMRLNNDTAGNYDYQRVQGQGASATALEGLTQTQGAIMTMPAASAAADLFGMAVIHIPFYAGTTHQKIATSTYSHKEGTATTNLRAGKYTHAWRSTAAITRVTLLPNSGNFVTGTAATLYGLMGVS